MVKICQTGLLKSNFETRPKKRIFQFLPKISADNGWGWKFFFAHFQILGPLGCQGWVVIPQNVKKKSKSLHPNDEPLLNLTRTMSRCSREKVLMYKQKRELESRVSSKYRWFSVYSTNKTGGRRKCLYLGHMQVNWAAAEHLLSSFSSPFFGVKLLYDYGLRGRTAPPPNP